MRLFVFLGTRFLTRLCDAVLTPSARKHMVHKGLKCIYEYKYKGLKGYQENVVAFILDHKPGDFNFPCLYHSP